MNAVQAEVVRLQDELARHQNELREVKNKLENMKALNPDIETLIRLASIIVHVEEHFSDNGHLFDTIVIKTLINNEKVQNWLKTLQKMALVPEKRVKP